MGLFTSLCKHCDAEIEWFLSAENGFLCEKCGRHNAKKDIWDNLMYPSLGYFNNKEEFIKKRKALRERKLKIEQIKKSL